MFQAAYRSSSGALTVFAASGKPEAANTADDKWYAARNMFSLQ
jgi:hypothetical protein